MIDLDWVAVLTCAGQPVEVAGRRPILARSERNIGRDVLLIFASHFATVGSHVHARESTLPWKTDFFPIIYQLAILSIDSQNNRSSPVLDSQVFE